MTTIFSLVIITGTFITLALLDRRRGLIGGSKIAEGEIYGKKLGDEAQPAK